MAKYKMKTHRGAAKRFRGTGGGGLKKYSAYTSHKTGKKSPKRRRQLRQGRLVASADLKRMKQLLPYA
ncbi:MAG: 50S ribosomal protein L35 [Bacillota bacterium]|jgi:large subunit ribosomal protein L35|nr:50S ribosomal protein L35 [Bacillota bacterium]HOB92363.1 50S ribosomal protein L35 [Bacillota bacterium]HPZ55474.1 50S ribosomal protein L35 [Bacillota bacterium]HQD18923.1 50S ribosomal protein L35 [Bacillota bacterium]